MLSIIVNKEITLRTYTPQDAAILFEAINRNRQHLRPWLPWVDGTTREEHSLIFIEDSLAQLENQQGMAFGIFYQEALIGGLGMLHWNHQLRKGQVGYWIDKDFEGKGIITDCLKRFIHFLFSSLDLNKIEIHFVVSNKRSAVIAEKLQAKIEGVLRDSYWVNGKTEDLVIAGILKKEWSHDLPDL